MKTIILTGGRTTMVSDDDYEWARHKEWHWANGYARAFSHFEGSKQFNVYLHRMVMQAPPDKQVDHINGDRLDNRRENLRLVTHAENHRAKMRKRPNCTSSYRGVCLKRKTLRWEANIGITTNGRLRQIFIGSFEKEKDAALAYNAKASELGFAPEALNAV